MTPTQILLVIFAGIVIIGMPVVIVWSIVDYLRKKPSKRRRGSGSTGLGAAFQELDRLVARPSVEHTVEAEQPIVKNEDDRGGQ